MSLKKNFIVKLLKSSRIGIYIAFRKLNTLLTSTDLEVLETTNSNTSRALQYWNIVFKQP